MEDELGRIRDRLHKLTDVIQVHEGQLAAHAVAVRELEKDVQDLQTRTATREQLDHAHRSVTQQLDHLKEDLAPMKRGIQWAVALIVGGFIAALISIVMRSGANP